MIVKKYLSAGFALIGILSLGAILGSSRANAQQGTPISKADRTVWEYKLIIPNETGPDQHERRRNNLEAQLNEAGQEGWEALEAPYLKGVRYQVIIMKRPKV